MASNINTLLRCGFFFLVMIGIVATVFVITALKSVHEDITMQNHAIMTTSTNSNSNDTRNETKVMNDTQPRQKYDHYLNGSNNTKAVKLVTTTNQIKYNVLSIDGLQINQFIDESPHCDHDTYNKDVLLFDVVSLHSVAELHLMAIRIFELCEYVDLFIINEIMFYPDGKRRNESLWLQKEKYININTILKPECVSKIVHHAIYRNTHMNGKQFGFAGDQLHRVYFDEMRRILQITKVFEGCLKYFGDKCYEGNMHNMFMIATDIDEIPRNNVVELIKRCDLKHTHAPIAADDWWHAYDFGCHLAKHEQRRIKIVSLKHVSPDIRYETNLRGSLATFQKSLNISTATRVKQGGWHLTYFGDVTDIIEKNKRKAHLFFHRGSWTDAKYQQCQYEICSYYVHGHHSYRVPFVNKSDAYYPLLVTANLSHDELSPFLRNVIDVNPNLYYKWLQYKNNITEPNHSKVQGKYCRDLIAKN